MSEATRGLIKFASLSNIPTLQLLVSFGPLSGTSAHEIVQNAMIFS